MAQSLIQTIKFLNTPIISLLSQFETNFSDSTIDSIDSITQRNKNKKRIKRKHSSNNLLDQNNGFNYTLLLYCKNKTLN